LGSKCGVKAKTGVSATPVFCVLDWRAVKDSNLRHPVAAALGLLSYAPP